MEAPSENQETTERLDVEDDTASEDIALGTDESDLDQLYTVETTGSFSVTVGDVPSVESPKYSYPQPTTLETPSVPKDYVPSTRALDPDQLPFDQAELDRIIEQGRAQLEELKKSYPELYETPQIPRVGSYYPSVPASPAYGSDVSVRGYTRSDGTYVQPHNRTRPNSSTWDNYSTKGNLNPYTGKRGTKRP